MDELKSKLQKLKEYSNSNEIEQLSKKIRELDLDNSVFEGLSKEKLIFVHVKLHNLIYFRSQKGSFDKIKEVHDRLVKFLDKHNDIDVLDAL